MGDLKAAEKATEATKKAAEAAKDAAIDATHRAAKDPGETDS
jgi:hypothetical protein